MTDMILSTQVAASPPNLTSESVLVQPVTPPAPDLVRDALMESRQRWRSLVKMATDLAFETDARGRFVFVIPDTALDWPAGSLIGQPSELLVGDDGSGGMFNPFRPIVEVRRRRAWLRRFDGKMVMMTISATPMFGSNGEIAGARGIGIDMTDYEAQTSLLAGRLRRGEVLDHVLSRVGHETGADNMMDAALWALIQALGAEGAAVIGAISEDAAIEILHECGPGASAILVAAARMMTLRNTEADRAVNLDGRFVLTVGCQTRFGAKAGLAIWRNADARPWDQDDTILAGSAVRIVRMILEYEAVQREMALQARTDPLTGLLNRRAFLAEMQRQIARLDRESQPGTLMFIDMDGFKAVNDRLGHGTGDRVLVHLAELLRKLVRPSDLIARLGGDEFALWLGGADHMTAAERADQLCRNVPVEIAALLADTAMGPVETNRVETISTAANPQGTNPAGPSPAGTNPTETNPAAENPAAENPAEENSQGTSEPPTCGVSIGIATRRVGSRESIEDLTRRADLAMYAVKRNGRNHWRVSLLDGD